MYWFNHEKWAQTFPRFYTIKLKNFFSQKSNDFETITLIENDMVISDDQKIADIFIEHFDTN